MPKKATPAPLAKVTPINEALLEQDRQAQNQLAAVVFSTGDNVLVLAQQLGYEGACTVGALEDGIRFYQQRTAEACLELGKRLLLLKEASLHGEFKPRLELLGIEYTAGTRFMAVAAKFSKVAPAQLLKAANNQRKLIELLVLDDSEIAELDEGATVRGISLDDVDRMSARELRAALREAQGEAEASEKLLAKKDEKINKLSRQIEKYTPDEVLQGLQKEASDFMLECAGLARGNFRQAIIAIRNHGEDPDAHDVFLGGLIGQVAADLAALRQEFNLPDLSNVAELHQAGGGGGVEGHGGWVWVGAWLT